jgi:hypothetical protein
MNGSPSSRSCLAALRPWPFGPPLRATPSGPGSTRRGRTAGCSRAGQAHPGQPFPLRRPGNGPRWGPRLYASILLCVVMRMSNNNKKCQTEIRT